ncbi:MAG: siphovirus Gp157 family protein [Streptococcaceae bacterium]|jgi:hypothetical protein|nr:siphovirus Gp157 family protein [Streptococcaceae bacterium]
MSSLYKLTGNWREVYELDIDDEVWVDTMMSIQESIEEKAVNIAHVTKIIENDNLAIDAEIKRLQAKKQANTNKVKSLKQYLQDSLVSIGERKIVTTLFTFAIQKNPPSVDITNEELIDQQYIKTEVVTKIDKKGLLADLKKGIEVAGAAIKQSESLRIR